jgi:arylsulfatase A-like enzyme
MNKLSSILVLMLLVTVFGVASGGDEFIFNATEDTWVNSGLPDENYGSVTAMRLVAGSKFGYYKFNVSGLTDSVESATLSIKSHVTFIPDTSAYSVFGEWSEDSLTYATDTLAWGGLLATVNSIDPNTWYDFDVTGGVGGDGSYTFGLKTLASGAGLKWLTRDSGTFAKLTVICGPNGGGVSEPNFFDAEVYELLAGMEAHVYNSTIAGRVSDSEVFSDPNVIVDPNLYDYFTFSLVSGPSWVWILGNGNLSGTPTGADIGSNSFVVRVSDRQGRYDDATFNMTVRPDPDITADGAVNIEDFGAIAENWLGDCLTQSSCEQIDLDVDGSVGINDVMVVAEKWLGGPKRPNIVLIMSDDVSPDLYGCYGNTQVSTPNIDTMAENGVMFRTAWATALCASSRAMIMTGRYGHRTRFFHNGLQIPQPDGSNELFKYHHSFGKLLKQAGYATAIAGKWHVSSSKPESEDGGFDEYCLWSSLGEIAALPGLPVYTGAYENEDTTARYWHPGIIQNHELIDTEPNDYGPDIFCDFLGDFIERKSAEGKPFLAYWPMVAPHGTRQGHATTPLRGEPGDIARTDSVENAARFMALNEYIDVVVGRLQQRVRDLGLEDNTIFIYCSDNGTGSTAKSRGVERGCRVVFVASGAGIAQRGATDEITDLSDILPTLLDYAGVELPEGYEVDGKSLKPFLSGQSDTHREWIYSNIGTTQLVRDRRYMLEVFNPILDVPTGRLYDCAASSGHDGVGYLNVTNMPYSELVQQGFENILGRFPALQAEHPYLASGTGFDWLVSYIAARNKHLHNHGNYQFYDEEVPLVAGDVNLAGGGNSVAAGADMTLTWDTAAVPGLAGNEAAFTFTWWLDGQTITGGTNETITVNQATHGDAGSYQSTATDGTTTFVSNKIDITVN